MSDHGKFTVDQSQPSIKLIILAGIALVVVFTSAYYGIGGLFNWSTTQHKYKMQEIWSTERVEAERHAKEELTEYRFIDKSAGTVKIPVSRAMELFVDESKAIPTAQGAQ